MLIITYERKEKPVTSYSFLGDVYKIPYTYNHLQYGKGPIYKNIFNDYLTSGL